MLLWWQAGGAIVLVARSRALSWRPVASMCPSSVVRAGDRMRYFWMNGETLEQGIAIRAQSWRSVAPARFRDYLSSPATDGPTTFPAAAHRGVRHRRRDSQESQPAGSGGPAGRCGPNSAEIKVAVDACPADDLASQSPCLAKDFE